MLFTNHFYEILRNWTQHSIRRPLRRFSTGKSWENQESPANLSLFTKPYLRSKADKKKQTNHAMSLQNPADSSKHAMELTSFTCLNLTKFNSTTHDSIVNILVIHTLSTSEMQQLFCRNPFFRPPKQKQLNIYYTLYHFPAAQNVQQPPHQHILETS